MPDKGDQKALGKQKDVVSQDRNWVLRINNELSSQQKWDTQWGYLSGGFSPQRTQVKLTIDDKIKQLEGEINSLDGQIYTQTSHAYGHGDKVQIFPNGKYNIKKNPDLRALQRRLPKDWKKQKWTPPVDPYDPLSKAAKKK